MLSKLSGVKCTKTQHEIPKSCSGLRGIATKLVKITSHFLELPVIDKHGKLINYAPFRD